MIVPLLLLAAQAKPPILLNGAFERGLTGWKAEGDARVVEGKLILGPGKGVVRQRYDVPGLRILWFGTSMKPSGPDVAAGVHVRCFDRKNRPLMDLRAPFDAKGYSAIYLKTQADTAYVVLSIEKTGEGGTVVADDALLQDDDKDRVAHAPQVDLAAMMRPIWKGDTVVDESALLLSKAGGRASGRLMFRPTNVLTVRAATLGTTYAEGKDFALEGNEIVALKGSPIPTMSDSEFAKGDLPWTRLDGRHIFVTYRHADVWKGPVPVPQGERLPETSKRLKAGKSLKLVAFGDSITLGINVSGFRNVPPYLPPWPTLAAQALGKNVQVVNASLGGMTSGWAKDNARDAVAALDPDLVIVAFGMNDFWSLTPGDFRKNVEATMATIRARRPKCEFVLVSPMRFDPAYTADPTYVGNLAGYAGELRKLVGSGVALVDMTALSEALYAAKSAKDLTTDPMHPDDFLARWYAQGLVATLAKP